MARGEGIDSVVIYKYIKQPNGNYTILDVPVFAPITRIRKNAAGEEIKMVATLDDLQKAIAQFEERKSRGYYPSIHKLHQDWTSNDERQSLGYLDNIYLADGIMFTDLTEITKDTLATIKQKQLCNRSLEYIFEENDIVSLALLASKPPHFKFPLLILGDKAENEDTEEFSVAAFSEGIGNRVEQFQQRSKNLNSISEGKNVDEPIKEVEVKDPVENLKEEAKKDDKLDAQVLALVKEQGITLKAIADILAKLTSKDAPVQASEEIKRDESKVLSSDNPSSVAFAQQFSQMTNMLNSMKNEIGTIKNERSINQFHQELKNMCEANPAINYESEKKFLEQFSDDKSKKAHLEYVKVASNNFLASTVPGRLLKGIDIEQFSQESADIQAVARQAKKDWRDTTAQFDIAAAQQFSQFWKDEETYVKNMVHLAKMRK